MQLGFLGFGKMGSRMVTKLLSEGHDVVGWNRSRERVESIKYQVSSIKNEENIHDTKYKIHNTDLGELHVAETIEDLVRQLTPPRVIWLMLTAGTPTEDVLSEVAKHAEPQDIVVDGGNAFYVDTQRRFETFSINSIRFLGIGVSGGIHAVDNGYPLMVGGDKSAYEHITPILDSLGKPQGGHAYFGTAGAGHFVKMVHNGIEYGMMQALGEGFGVLDKAPYPLDLLDVAKLWQKSTIVSGFLLDRAKDALEKDPHLDQIDGVVAASGEGDWTVDVAKKEGVPIKNIEQSLEFRKESQKNSEVANTFAAKMVAALRHEFGGHELKKK